MSSIFHGLRRFGIAAIWCCFAFGLSTAAHAQTFTISNASGSSGGNATYPNIVTDANGNLNLVWIDSVKGIMFARTSSSGGTTTLGTAVNVPGSGVGAALPAFQPQIAVYSNPSVINIAWAAVHPGSTSTPPTYDIWVARSDDSGQHFALPPAGPISLSVSPTGVVLADGPRLAFDQTGKINVVWGEHEAWISWSQDGINSFSAPMNLAAVTNPPTSFDTGGPRIAVDNLGRIFVAWTDELAEKLGTPNTYCTTFPPTTDSSGKYTAISGGHVWMNETDVPQVAGGGYSFNSANTRDLSSTDWAGSITNLWPLGFYGCSFDNLNLVEDSKGYMHLVWSDDQPDEDVLTSYGTGHAYPTPFSFPINLASVSAASPRAIADNSGSLYVVWSGGPGGGTGVPSGINSQGAFFSRSDDQGSNFLIPAINVAAPDAVAPAYPQITVDCPLGSPSTCQSKGVSLVWEQMNQQPVTSSDTFNIFFSHSTDKGNTFPTTLQVSTNPSALCLNPSEPGQTTPDNTNTSCGTVQIGMDAGGNPDMAWVNQASGASTTNLDFAMTNLGAALSSDFSISASPVTQTAQPAQTVNFSVDAAAVNGFSGSINLGCENFSAVTETPGKPPAIGALSALTCTPITPSSITPGQTSTVSVTVPSGILANGATSAQMTFVITGTSAAVTHRIPVTIFVGANSAPGSITPASANLTASQPSAQFTVNANPADFTGKVQFTCLDADTGSTPPSWLDCSNFAPNPLDLTTGSSTTWTVTRKSAPPATSMLISAPPSPAWPAYGGSAAWTMVLLGICLISSMFVLGRRRGASTAVLMRGFFVMTLTIVLAAGLVSCGGSTSTPSSTNSTGASGTGGSGGTGASGGTGGSGGSGGSGGTGGGNSVTVHLEVLAQSSSNSTPIVLGTVTINAQ